MSAFHWTQLWCGLFSCVFANDPNTEIDIGWFVTGPNEFSKKGSSTISGGRVGIIFFP
jgi:hypothetical protein